MRNDQPNLIVDLTFEFALQIIDFSETLKTYHKYEMASQVFRCGTSIGANIKEAQNAQSKADFIHKFKIAAKEADETAYWLDLSQNSKFYPNPPETLLVNIKSIILITTKIIASSKRS